MYKAHLFAYCDVAAIILLALAVQLITNYISRVITVLDSDALSIYAMIIALKMLNGIITIVWTIV